MKDKDLTLSVLTVAAIIERIRKYHGTYHYKVSFAADCVGNVELNMVITLPTGKDILYYLDQGGIVSLDNGTLSITLSTGETYTL